MLFLGFFLSFFLVFLILFGTQFLNGAEPKRKVPKWEIKQKTRRTPHVRLYVKKKCGLNAKKRAKRWNENERKNESIKTDHCRFRWRAKRQKQRRPTISMNRNIVCSPFRFYFYHFFSHTTHWMERNLHRWTWVEIVYGLPHLNST